MASSHHATPFADPEPALFRHVEGKLCKSRSFKPSPLTSNKLLKQPATRPEAPEPQAKPRKLNRILSPSAFSPFAIKFLSQILSEARGCGASPLTTRGA